MSLLSQEPTQIVKESVSILSRLERSFQNPIYYEPLPACPNKVTNDCSERLLSLYECDPLDLSILEVISQEPGSVSSSIALSVYTSKCTVLNRSANLEILGLIERKQQTKGGAYENYLRIDLEPLVAHTTQEVINSNMLQLNDSGKHNIDWVQQISQCNRKPFRLFVQLFAKGGQTAKELKLISSDPVSVQTIYSRLNDLIDLNLVCRQYCDKKEKYIFIAQPSIPPEAIIDCLSLQKFAEVKHILSKDIQMIEGYSSDPDSVVSKATSIISSEDEFIGANSPSSLNESIDIEPIENKLGRLRTVVLEILEIVVSFPQICSRDIKARHHRDLNDSTIHDYLVVLMEAGLVSRSQLNVNNKQGRLKYFYIANENINVSMIEEILSVRYEPLLSHNNVKVEQKVAQLSTVLSEQKFDSNGTRSLPDEVPQSMDEASQPIHEESPMDRLIEKLVGKIHNFDDDIGKVATVLEDLVGKVHSLETNLEQALITIAQYQIRFEGIESCLSNAPQMYNRQKLDRLIESLK